MTRFQAMAARWLACLLVLALSACASLPDPAPGVGPPEFELQGRIAMRYGEEGGNARIEWRHALDSDELLVTNSLGQGIARISRNGQDIRLLTADNTEHRAADAETLTESVLGWRLPLAGLPSWVRGSAVQGRPARVERNAAGRVEWIEQDAWRIQYLAWEGNLPARMVLAHKGGEGKVPIEIRLVVDRWNAT